MVLEKSKGGRKHFTSNSNKPFQDYGNRILTANFDEKAKKYGVNAQDY